ncbi:MAG TPA: M56 family metallopeptidase [Rhodanobacteraceae bacterium]|nr:M56 family metallopeptidase [Rhodanobacteraceae bacterium]
MALETLAAWLITLGLHAGILLGIAWAADRGALRARPAWRETLWRTALFGAALSASVQMFFDAPSPARIELPAHAVVGQVEASSKVAVADRRASALPSLSAGTQGTLARADVRARSAAPAAGARSAKTAPAWSAWPRLVLAAWLAGALIAMTRVLIAWLRLERMLAHAGLVADAALATDAAALAIEARTNAPRLAALDELASPLAASGGRIVLPRWAVELLDREQLRAMLAHETAHVARRDPAWKLAAAFWSALVWFVPLVPLARRRLDEIAEISCDAWAAIHLGDGRSLAECLAECAGHRVGAIDPGLAPAMAARESPLLQRIDYLIAGAPMNLRSAGFAGSLAAVAALAIAAFALPGVREARATEVPPSPPEPPAAPAAPAPPASPPLPSATHVHMSSSGGSSGERDSTVVQVSDGANRYRVEIDGKIAFNERENDVESLSDGGTARFEETRAGKTLRLDVASRGGKLERRYYIDDKEQPAGAETEAWMAKLIPTVIRESAIGAEARVRRLRDKGGAGAVLDEIARIQSGYARGVYVRELAASGKLSKDEMTRALTLVGAIDSDYEKRNALAALANVQPLDAEQQKLVLTQADSISSDYERAELLVGLLPQLAKSADVRAAWLKASSGIASDYEHRRVLSALLETGVADDATLATVVDAAATIGSDYERRSLLADAAARTSDAEHFAAAYGAAAAKIGSDYERREALMALVRAQGFGKTASRVVLDAAADIGSDYECRELLVALAGRMPHDADLISRYREVAGRLSRNEREEAERAIDRFAAR